VCPPVTLGRVSFAKMTVIRCGRVQIWETLKDFIPQFPRLDTPKTGNCCAFRYTKLPHGSLPRPQFAATVQKVKLTGPDQFDATVSAASDQAAIDRFTEIPRIEDRRMETIRIDRRSEGRTQCDVELLVWGIDTAGERFVQHARAENISPSGALLTGLQAPLKSGDVLGILYAGRKARFRVVWVRYDGIEAPMRAAVHRIEPDVCPWLDLLAKEQSREFLSISVTEQSSDPDRLRIHEFPDSD
jgi:hypothetical protein